MTARFGRYHLLERLGAGGMAEVYKARSATQQTLVIKRIVPALRGDADLAALFVREGRLAVRLEHPNIVRVFESGRVGDEPFLAMEYVEGVDLRALLARSGALPLEVVTYLGREVAAALAFVHDARGDDGARLNLVHRDVSPSNVLLGIDGSVKLCDFGIARTDRDTKRTRTGNFRGKIAYAAPEVLQGSAHDGRSDLFALGAVLHECVTGDRLFAASTDIEMIGQVIAGVVPPVSASRPDVSPQLEAVCLTLLARLPSERYESAHEVVRALTVADEGAARAALARLVSAARGPASVHAARPSTRPLVVGVGVAVTIALGASAALFTRSPPAADAVHHVESTPPRAPPPQLDAGREPSADVSVLVESTPPGATVKSPTGVVLGQTPLRLAPGPVVVERKGYRRRSVTIEAPTNVLLVPMPRGPKPAGLKNGAVLDPFE